MPITINGSGTITGLSVGGLPDGIVDTDMLANNAVTSAKSTIAEGKVVNMWYDDIVENKDTSSAAHDPGFKYTTLCTITLTPSSTSNKLLVYAIAGWRNHQQSSHGASGIRLKKDGSVLTFGNYPGYPSENKTPAHAHDSTISAFYACTSGSQTWKLVQYAYNEANGNTSQITKSQKAMLHILEVTPS